MRSVGRIFLISFLLLIFVFIVEERQTLISSSEIVEKQDSVLDCYFTENLEPKKQPTCDVIAKEMKRSKFNEKVKCSFLAIPGHLRKNISMEEGSGIIHLTTPIDREAICLTVEEDCFIKVDVVIKPVATLKIVKVRLHIVDVNDNAPQFPTASQHFEVSETAEPGASFILPDAADPDSGRNGLYGYRLIPPQENFELLPMQQRSSLSLSGSQEILVARSAELQIQSSLIQSRQNHLSTAGSSHLRLSLRNHLDREIRDAYIFKIEAFDGGDPRRSSTMLINITVIDSNDNVPQFGNSSYEIQVKEDVPINTTLLRLRAKDPDQGLNGLVRYHFTLDTLSRYGDIYLLDEVTGRLTTRAALDYETCHLMMLYVTASDQGPNEKLSSQALVVVKLQDVNDNSPIIRINSQSQPFQSLKSKTSSHPPSKSNPLANTRSYFNASKVEFNPRRNLSKNEFLPQVFENSGVGTFVAHITVEDADSEQNGKFECKLFQNSPNNSRLSDVLNELSKDFLLSQMYQTEFKLITARIFDRETSGREQAAIHCSDFGEPPLTSSLKLNVQILDRNDNAPTFLKQSFEASANEDTPLGTSLIQLTATDLDEGANGEVNFSLSVKNKSSPIEIDSTTGIVTTVKVLELKPNVTKFEAVVVASDKGTPMKSSSVKLVVHVHDVVSERTDFTQQLYRFSVQENSNFKTFVGKVEVKSIMVPPTRTLQYFLTTTPCRINSTYHAVFEFANLPFRVDADKGSVWSVEQLDREEQEFYSFFVVAYLNRKSQEVPSNYKFGVGSYQAIRSKIISCAVIEIVVEDQNDNLPYFTFPSTGNDHVYFSLDEAPGLAITKLSAYDPDFIHNANLKFSIESGNEDNLFELESSSGMLFLSRYIEMSDIDNPMRENSPPEALEFHRHLVVSVTDQGFPSMNSSSVLVLVARNELLQSETKSSNRLRQSERNKLHTVYQLLASEDLAQTLAITLAVILVLISSLIAAICLIKNKQRRRESNNCNETSAHKNAHKSSSCYNDIGNTTSKMLLLSGDAFPRLQNNNNNKNVNNNNNDNNKSATSGLFGSFGKKKYQKAAVENHHGQSNDLAMNWRPFYSMNISHDDLPPTTEETETLFHPNIVGNIASTSTSKFEFSTKIIDISNQEQEAINPVNSKQCSMMSFVKHFYNDFIKASSPTSESNSDSGRGQSSGDDVTKVSQRHVIFKRCEAEMKL